MKLLGAREVLLLLLPSPVLSPPHRAKSGCITFPGLISTMTVKERFEIRTVDVLRDGRRPTALLRTAIAASLQRTRAPMLDRAITSARWRLTAHRRLCLA